MREIYVVDPGGKMHALHDRRDACRHSVTFISGFATEPPTKMMAGMTNDGKPQRSPLYLGIEAGGTRTVAVLEATEFGQGQELEFGPANLRLLNDAQLALHFRNVAKGFPKPDAIAIGMAGARTDADRKRIRVAADAAWPGVPCYATDDLETALCAAEEPTQDPRLRSAPRRRSGKIASKLGTMPRVLIVSGTGSCCFGQTHNGKTAKVGGWGHILGDKGSGYEIGLRALKAVIYYFDRDGEWSGLGQRILRTLQLNEPNELIGWVLNASKKDIAALAIEVFKSRAQGDRIASDILKGAAASLARDGAACAAHLARAKTPVQFVLAGSVLRKQPRFAQMVSRELKRLWPAGIASPLKKESVHGAVALAKLKFPVGELKAGTSHPHSSAMVPFARLAKPDVIGDVASIKLSPTEQRNPRSMNLDRLPLRQAVELMLREDALLPTALLAERKKIEQGVKSIVRSFQKGGRLFYVGAGTSGRLGVLDASECPPTFRSDPEMVQGIIAGGQTALWQAVEGAEDDPQAGARAIQFRGVGRHDTVVGIAASGRTPFVWGALRAAKRRGATTMLLCFNPNLVIPRAERPDLVIAPKIGPEILTGSTRLKSGTATKLILNIFTTLAMVRMGKVLGNLMIDVKASNTKLRDRAVRIVRELTGVDYAAAEAALVRTEWKIKPACARLGRK